MRSSGTVLNCRPTTFPTPSNIQGSGGRGGLGWPLKVDYPDQPEMQVSTETIYQSLYVQSRGALKQDLTSESPDMPGRFSGLTGEGMLPWV